MDLRYRSHLGTQCAAITGKLCAPSDKIDVNCLKQVNASMRDYYKRLRPLLPSKLDGNGISERLYEKALPEIDAIIAKGNFECYSLVDGQFESCEFITLSANMMDLIYRARVANINLP